MEGGKPDRPLAARDSPFAGIPGGVEYTVPKNRSAIDRRKGPLVKMEELLYSISSQVDLFLEEPAMGKVSLMCRTCERPKQIFLGVRHELYVCEEDYEFFAGVLKGQHKYNRHKHCTVMASYLEDEISGEMTTEECPDFWFIQGRGMNEEEMYDAAMPEVE